MWGGVEVAARQVVNELGEKTEAKDFGLGSVWDWKRAASNDVDEALSCPENSVLSGEWNSSAAYNGMQCADQGRPGLGSEFFQSFSGCRNVVTGVRVLGIFNYYSEDGDWLSCNSRGGADENGNLTEPILFEVGFYRMGDDGMPGEEVYREEVAIVGKHTGVVRNGSEPIYEFTANLKEEIRLESGFVQFSAVDMGDSPSCWFCVVTNSDVPGYGQILLSGESWMSSMNSMCYCLLGDASRPIAEKSLKLERVLSPETGENSSYAKVQVELSNVGNEDVGDAALELWEGGTKLAVEKVDAVIEKGDVYKYTFLQRVDCSGEGEHHFTIKNVTPGDELIAGDRIAFSTAYSSGLGESYSQDSSMDYITSVSIGSISNNSEPSVYSDFRDLKTEIKPGEVLPLTVEANTNYIKVWIDWNGNESFADNGDFVGYITDGSIDVAIPEGKAVTAGEKCMRIIGSYEDVAPVGVYAYGETEDYTLVVARPENCPVMVVDKDCIEKKISKGESCTEELVIANGGEADMDVALNVDYVLPYSPNVYPVSRASVSAESPKLAMRKAAMRQDTEPVEAEAAGFVLKYDRGYSSLIGLENSNEATYAAYYPGEMLAGLAGMEISSVDVYVADLSDKSEVVIYGEKSQSHCGELLLSQEFAAIENSWNRIVLDTPLAVGDTDLWIGVRFTGISAGEMQVGIDVGPANVGFGDIVNIGGSTWWSLSDLGNDYNVCVRANITGEKTPAISWIAFDKDSFAVEMKEEEVVNVKIDPTGLDQTLYEAAIEVRSNDPVANFVRIPVYADCSENSGICDITEMITAKVYADSRNTVVVESDKQVSYMVAVDAGGNMVRMAYSNRLNLSDVQRGVYVVDVVYVDGTHEAITVAVR